MPTNINFNALNPPVNAFGAFQAGMENGRALRNRQTQENALAAYAQNPNDTQAVQQIIPINPQLGMSLREQQVSSQRQTQIGQLAPRAAMGDRRAIGELYGLDPEIASKFNDQQRKAFDEGMKAIGDGALQVAIAPEQDRPALFDSLVDQLSQRFPELAQYRGKYSPQILQAVLAQTGNTQKAIELTSPKYTAVPAGGGVTNVNPYSPGFQQQGAAQQPTGQPTQPGSSMPDGGNYVDVGNARQILGSLGPQGFVQWQQKNNVPVKVNGPQDVAALPPGTLMVSPDGRVGVKR